MADDLKQRLQYAALDVAIEDTVGPWDYSAIYAEAKSRIEALEAELAEANRILGGGCVATRGDHVVIRQGSYSFCAKCGESLKGIRFCHEPRASLSDHKARRGG